MGGARREVFDEVIRREIKRRIVQDHNCSMNRSEVEHIGAALWITRKDAVREFMRLAGSLWVGEVIPDGGAPVVVIGPVKLPPTWLAVHFDIAAMQRLGTLSQPLPQR